MAKYRYVYTEFWRDPRVMEEMTPEDRYFYLYLLTNPLTTQCGIYSITKKQMAFDIGHSAESINSLVERFENHHKLIRYNPETREMAIIKWGKYNLIKGGKPVIDCVKKEVNEVKDKSLLKCVGENVENEDVRKIFLKAAQGSAYFEPSKTYKPKDKERITTEKYVLWRDKQTCFYTGLVLQKQDVQIDHIKSKSSGGDSTPGNLVVSYAKFNNFKSGENDLAKVIANWNEVNVDLQVNIIDVCNKIDELKEFEELRRKHEISYRDSISNNIYDTYTLRNYINTIRGQKEKEKEKEKQKDKKTSCRANKFDDQHMKLAQLLFKLMRENNPKAKKPNFDSWANEFRLAMQMDNRNYDELEYLIRWSQQDSFWRTNILSPAKLRKQVDQLELIIKTDKTKHENIRSPNDFVAKKLERERQAEEEIRRRYQTGDDGPGD
jgi:hypothetical protein